MLPTEYYQHIEILLNYKYTESKENKSSTTGSETVPGLSIKECEQYYNDCNTFLYDEYHKLDEEICKTSYELSLKERKNIEAKYQEWQKLAKKMQELLHTKGADKLDKYLDASTTQLIWIQKQNDRTLLIIDKIHQLMLSDSSFRDICNQMPNSFQQNIIQAFLYAYPNPTFSSEEPLSAKYTIEELITKTQKAILKWALLATKNNVDVNDYRNLLEFYFKSLGTANTEKAERLIDLAFEITKQSKNQGTALKTLGYDGLYEPYDWTKEEKDKTPWTIDDIENRFRLLQKLEQHPEKPADETVFDSHMLREIKFYADQYDQHPELCWRLKKHNCELNHYGYMEPGDLSTLINLFEAISPDDVNLLIRPILNSWIHMTRVKCANLIKVLAWMRDSIIKDSSASNKENMSGFADRILALLWDNAELAEEVFTLPEEKYPALCEFMLTKTRFNDLELTDFAGLFQDDKPRLAKIICDLLETIVKQDSTLRLPLHYWLNTILKMHDATFDKSKEIGLNLQLEKLPLHYLQLIQKMLKVTKSQPKCVEQFISLSSALPYSESMRMYLERLEKINDEKLLATMEAFNALVSDNPKFFPQLLDNLELVISIKKLKEIDQTLFLAMAPKYLEEIGSKSLEKIMANSTLRLRLVTLFKLEKKRSIDLTSMFLNDTASLASLKTPLFETIVNNPRFAEKFSIAFSKTFIKSIENRAERLEKINKLLTSNAKAVFELFEFMGRNVVVLHKFLNATIKNESFFIHDTTGKDEIQTLYHLVRDFQQTYYASHPEYAERILWLIENDENSLARKLLKFSSHETNKSYLANLFDLMKGEYYSVSETILDELEKKSDDSFIVKLITLASRKNGSLIQECLRVDKTTESELYNYILKSSIDNFNGTKFRKIMLLRAQGDTVNYKKQLQDIDKPEISHVIVVSDLKKIEKTEIKSESLEKTILSFMSEDDIKALNEKDLNAEQRAKLTLGIGQTLITQDGMLNTEVIDQIKATSVYKKIENTPLLKKYLDRVLETIKQYPAFAERLMQQEAPPSDSLAKLIIQKSLGLSPEQTVNAYHARVLILSALLYPIRQGDVGSCFATSVLIQAASYPDGLLQMLEDYMSLLSQDCISRTKRTADKSVLKFPMDFNFEDFSKTFAKDNLLARAYEYTVAKMSALYQSDDSVKGFVKNILWGIFNEEIRSQVKTTTLPSVDLGEIECEIMKTLPSIVDELCSMTYDGHTKHPHTGDQGAWRLLDAETHQFLGKDEKVEANFYDKMLNKCRDKLIQSIPKQAAIISELFDKKMHDYVRSSAFHKRLFTYMGFDEPGVSRINCAKYPHLSSRSPYMAYEGGYTGCTIKNFNNQAVIFEHLPYQYNPLKTLETFAKKLDEEKEVAPLQSDMLMNCGNASHAFTFDIGKIKQLTKKGAETNTKEMRKAAADLAKTALSEAVYNEIIESYISNQYYPNVEIRNLHKKLLIKNIKGYSCLSDLCDEIVTTDRELMGCNRTSVGRLIDWAIRSCPSLQDKLPPVFYFADPNWETHHQIGLSCRVHNNSMDYVISTNSNKPGTNWSPKFLSTWTVYRHPSGTDEISRSYFRKSQN